MQVTQILRRSLPFIFVLAFVGNAAADDLIAWKFQPGQRLGYQIVQEMTISGSKSDEPQSKTRQQLDITWEVLSVNDKGMAVVRHRFDRIRSQMTLPNGHLEFDTAAEGPPAGMAAINAPLYRALVKWPAEITVTSDGRIESVKMPDEVLAAVKKLPTAATFGNLGNVRTFQALFLAGIPQLSPSPREAVAQWSTESEVDLPSAGKQLIVTQYHNDGRRSVSGATLAVIRPVRTVTFSGDDASKRTVKNQSTTGELLFDMTAGRLLSTTLKHTMTIAMNVGGRPTEQTIEQSIEVKSASKGPAGSK